MINLYDKPVYGVVTVNNWLYQGDGNSYKAVWGLCQAKKAESIIGCKTGSGQADFLIVVGKEANVIIPGCEFIGFIKRQKVPTDKNVLIVRDKEEEKRDE